MGREKIGPFGTVIEKDPTIDLLEKNLWSKIQEILPKEPEPVKKSNMIVREVSFEDAIKELLAMIKDK